MHGRLCHISLTIEKPHVAARLQRTSKQFSSRYPKKKRHRPCEPNYPRLWQYPETRHICGNANIYIIDVTVAFENRMPALEMARDNKQEKYQALAAQVQANTGKPTSMRAFLVGSLGSWLHSNEEVRCLQISRKYSFLMKNLWFRTL